MVLAGGLTSMSSCIFFSESEDKTTTRRVKICDFEAPPSEEDWTEGE